MGGPGLPQGPHGWPCRAVGAWGAPEQALCLQPLLVEQAEIHTEEQGQQKCQHEDPGQASRAPPSSLHGVVCVAGGVLMFPLSSVRLIILGKKAVLVNVKPIALFLFGVFAMCLSPNWVQTIGCEAIRVAETRDLV